MDASPLNNQIKGFFIVAASLLLATFMGYLVGTEDYDSLLIGIVVVVGVWLWFFSGRFFWILTIASSFLEGTFPILRGQFTPFQILMAMGLAKFLVEDVILRRVRLKLPSRLDLLMIAGFMSIILVHGVNDRFGMRFLGSTIWGGRNYVNVFVGLAAFFVIQSIPMNSKWWVWFPYAVLAVSGFDLAIALITTVAPGSIYLIYPFYSAVSNSSLQEAIGGPISEATGRIGAIGNFGFILIIFIMSTMSIRRMLHPSNFFRLVGVGIGSIFVLLSGYRSAVINALIAAVVVGVRDLRYAALALLPLLAAGLFALSVINSEIVHLPKPVQRGLAFLPGDWDSDMAQDARSSNDFRYNVWSLWWQRYFPEHPLLGRGFGFQSQWTEKSIWLGDAADYQQMVETGNIHNGLFAAVDTFGLVGTIFFVIWNIAILFRALQISFDRRRGEYLALRFLALYLATSIIFYWGGATSIGSFVPGEFALVGLFLRLRRDLKPAEKVRRIEPAPVVHQRFRRELARA